SRPATARASCRWRSRTRATRARTWCCGARGSSAPRRARRTADRALTGPAVARTRAPPRMTRAADSFDVVVIGGGPAGSVASTLLADAGHRVVVLERERFPRYHIGESLLSATLPILDAIGATAKIEAHGFLRKPGGTFQWGRQAEPWSFWFKEDPGGRPYAFQVIRSEFDHILLSNARRHGAEVREEHAVTSVDTSRDTPVVVARRADGRELRFAPRLVVDASGQQALLGRALGLRRFNEFFKNLAVF